MNKLRTEYRRYQVSGGMPEAVVALLENKGIGEVESTLQGILDLYELDFVKYAEPREIPRIHAIWPPKGQRDNPHHCKEWHFTQ